MIDSVFHDIIIVDKKNIIYKPQFKIYFKMNAYNIYRTLIVTNRNLSKIFFMCPDTYLYSKIIYQYEFTNYIFKFIFMSEIGQKWRFN